MYPECYLKSCIKLRDLRTSPERLRLSERFKIKVAITGILVVRRRSFTQRLNRSVSPFGWTLKRLPALSGSLERTRHYTALPFAHYVVLLPTEKVQDLFAGSLSSYFYFTVDIQPKPIGLSEIGTLI